MHLGQKCKKRKKKSDETNKTPRGGEFKKKQNLQSKDVKQLGFKNKAPRSGEFKKKFRILAGWLCLPCCAAGESTFLVRSRFLRSGKFSNID